MTWLRFPGAAAIPWNTCPVHGFHGSARCPWCTAWPDPEIAVVHAPLLAPLQANAAGVLPLPLLTAGGFTAAAAPQHFEHFRLDNGAAA